MKKFLFLLSLLLATNSFAADVIIMPLGGPNSSDVTITGGTINGTVIGGTTPAYGTFAGITIVGGQSTKKTNVSDADYNPSVLTTDYKIAFTSLTAARAATISTEDVQSGTTTQTRDLIFKDESGSAGTYPITITLESGGTIDGAASYVLNTNYEAVNIYLNGTNGFAY